MVGAAELARRLPGAIDAERPGHGSKRLIVPLYIKPRPSVIAPDGRVAAAHYCATAP
jgi:hypothetical protein